MTGTLFDIKEFAVHDGPGIRTTIFLKGCPLRCAWCHNPEGLSFEPETLHTANGDRQCGEVVEVNNLAERLRRASFLYGEDGGVTFSGGEPLAQAEFVLEMIDALKPIHVAVQTSGHAPVNVFQSIVEAVDFVMLDIKHSDREIHKRFTGVDNSLIGENLRFLVNSGKRFEVHIPLIPGVTDTRENIQPIADALASAGDRVSVLLMPYHRNAGAKYAMVGREFTPDWDENARVKDHSDIFHKAGIGSRML